MNTTDLTKSDIATLVADYRKAAVEHGVATERGDHRKANRHHDVIAAVYRELRHRGNDAQCELLPLLDDMNVHVRAWAAAHALEFAPERGESVLRRLSTKDGVVGLNAQMTLTEWSKVALTFP